MSRCYSATLEPSFIHDTFVGGEDRGGQGLWGLYSAGLEISAVARALERDHIAYDCPTANQRLKRAVRMVTRAQLGIKNGIIRDKLRSEWSSRIKYVFMTIKSAWLPVRVDWVW